MVTEKDLRELHHLKYGEHPGWGPRARLRFRYFTPDDVYEAAVSKLISEGCFWLDVGCGRDVFPDHPKMAKRLADRCQLLVGVDPDTNIEDNLVVHQKARTTIEKFRSDYTFDLITMRMVAEHISNPEETARVLAQLVKPGGRVVIYTVNKNAPLAVLARVIPFKLHHAIKRFFWRTEERDTFPVVYAMNTSKELATLFVQAGFREQYFAYLDDCRTFFRFKWLSYLELTCQFALRSLGFRYPENCLMGIYQKVQDSQGR